MRIEGGKKKNNCSSLLSLSLFTFTYIETPTQRFPPHTPILPTLTLTSLHHSSSSRRNGQVQEPHHPQPVRQEPSQRYQEAQTSAFSIPPGCGPRVFAQPTMGTKGTGEGVFWRAGNECGCDGGVAGSVCESSGAVQCCSHFVFASCFFFSFSSCSTTRSLKSRLSPRRSNCCLFEDLFAKWMIINGDFG